MTDSRFHLGIDGGGSSTRALLADESGHVLGLGHAASSNCNHAGVEGAQREIEKAVNAAFQMAGVPRRKVRAAFLGLAGIVSEYDHAIARGIAERLALAEQI